MNAIQFIKDHGVEKAREVVEGAPEGVTHYCHGSYWNWDGEVLKRCLGKGFFIVSIYGITNEWASKAVSLSDLKRLVESVDLVESWGGIEVVKRHDLELCKSKPESAGYRLIQAIADYESIYGGEHV